MGKEIYTERADLFDPNIYIQFLIDITGIDQCQIKQLE